MKHQNTNRTLIGWTKNGMNVYVMNNSKHKYYEKGLTMPLLYDVLGRINYEGPHKSVGKFTMTFNHHVGRSKIVETAESESVENAILVGHTIPYVVVYGREPEPSNKVTVILKRFHNSLILIDCYIGGLTPRFPLDPRIATDEELKKSQDFWANHAMAVCHDEIDIDKTHAYFEEKEEICV